MRTGRSAKGAYPEYVTIPSPGRNPEVSPKDSDSSSLKQLVINTAMIKINKFATRIIIKREYEDST
jgi:hypothetical protein